MIEPAILRRAHVPRLRASPRRARTGTLPGFLSHPASWAKMQRAPLMGPPDPLEQAILTGKVWQDGAPPVEMPGFDPQSDVLSLVFEGAQSRPTLKLKHERSGETCLYADEKPVARFADARSRLAMMGRNGITVSRTLR